MCWALAVAICVAGFCGHCLRLGVVSGGSLWRVVAAGCRGRFGRWRELR